MADRISVRRGVPLRDAAHAPRQHAIPAPPLREPHEPLYRLAYVSCAVAHHGAVLRHQAEAIAAASARRNAAMGVSGALAVGGGWFAQVLEGGRSEVAATFERVLDDPRHTDIRLLEFAPIARRRFIGWSMAWSGDLAPDMVRRAVLGYARQEKLATSVAARHGAILAAAMMAKLHAA